MYYNLNYNLKEKKLNSLIVGLDMRGCPNRCRHCWLGHAPNGNLTGEDLRFVRDAFRPYADRLELDTWVREPDYADDYRELWALRAELSDAVTPHFELMSVWRAARDPGYIPWLYEMGVRQVQLTLFGGERLTDRYTGRRGAYRDILESIERLLRRGIAPRLQVFLNQETAPGLGEVEALIRTLRLPERCRDIGQEFACFVHAGSCDGANQHNYSIWPTRREVAMIPSYLAEHTLRHFGGESLDEVFGQGEGEWVRLLRGSEETQDIAAGVLSHSSPGVVLYLDAEMNVYPNVSAMEPQWRLGNLRADGAEAVLNAFLQNRSPAQRVRAAVPLGELVRAGGDAGGEGLFTRDDYIIYLLNKYCQAQA